MGTLFRVMMVPAKVCLSSALRVAMRWLQLGRTPRLMSAPVSWSIVVCRATVLCSTKPIDSELQSGPRDLVFAQVFWILVRRTSAVKSSCSRS